jgi:hypothetical protein
MQATIHSLSGLQYAEPFNKEIQLWSEKVTTLHEALLRLNQIQHTWLHLAPICNSGALTCHTKKINGLDNQFKGIMSVITKDPQVTSLLNKHDIVSCLKGIQGGLDACQSAPMEFLESKRQGFPRLYFINDIDLFEIIGKVRKDPSIIQSHLTRLFQGIATVKVDGENRIVGYLSSMGEKVWFTEPVFTATSVEVWLSELTASIASMLKQTETTTAIKPYRECETHECACFGISRSRLKTITGANEGKSGSGAISARPCRSRTSRSRRSDSRARRASRRDCFDDDTPRSRPIDGRTGDATGTESDSAASSFASPSNGR